MKFNAAIYVTLLFSAGSGFSQKTESEIIEFGLLPIASTEYGTRQAEIELKRPPMRDGMAAAHGKLICLTGENQTINKDSYYEESSSVHLCPAWSLFNSLRFR
ncbi:MAG TPA: hypothetical protein EYQ50_16595 [Verrucomicrobiales bacterium]|nr:hypothetical protein [Verrucomicrobiales bacterium]